MDKAKTKRTAEFQSLNQNTSPSPPVSRTNRAWGGGTIGDARGVRMSPGARSGMAHGLDTIYGELSSRFHMPGKPRWPARASLAHPGPWCGGELRG